MLLLGCAEAGRGPIEPHVPAIASLDILPDFPVKLLTRDSFQLMVSAVDTGGRPLGIADGAYRLRSSVAGVATVSRGGIVRTLSAGQTWIIADTGAGTPADSVLVEVSEPTGAFRIRLIFAPDVPILWRVVLGIAAERWQSVMAGELAPQVLDTPGGDCPTPPGEPPSPPLSGEERGVVIYVGQSSLYPPGTYVEATGGPCLQRPLPRPTTVLGMISLNRAKPVDSIPGLRLSYLALHEMGHVLGLVGVVQGEQPPWYDFHRNLYTGAMAIEAMRRLGGVELNQVALDGGSHWGPLAFADVMSGLGNNDTEISLLSIGALLDAGYPALWSKAGF